MNTPSRNRNRLADSRQYNEKCVCQICTCGRHHCPPSGHRPFEGETTHHHDYKAYPLDGNQGHRPCTHHYHERHYDPDAMKTSYDLSYVPHKMENRCPIDGSKYQYRPRTGKFYDETEYKKNYQNKEIIMEPPRQCSHLYNPNRAKFEGTTTYTAEFSPKKTQNAFVPPPRYERKKVPFQGTSTYSASYRPHQLEQTQNIRQCRCHHNRPRTRFEGQSHYKTNYRPYEIEHDAHCPILDMPQYPRKCSPGKTHVNYSAEKDQWY